MTVTMTCAKCKRELHPWPLVHSGCAPKYWVNCISTDDQRRVVTVVR